jgi:phenylacetic acid degradation operon negative regulatory protein
MQRNGTPAPRTALLHTVPSTRANSFVTDICAWFVRNRVDGLKTATWVSLLATVGISSGNARSALHRLTKAGYLERRRLEGRPGYGISPAWAEWVDRAAGEDPLEANELEPGWTLLTFSVPETRRADRHDIRTLLGRLGFASLGNGVWIASAGRQEELRRALEMGGMEGYVDLFLAEYTGFLDVGEFARRCWDIDGIAGAYRAFIKETRRRLKNRPAADARAFTDVVLTSNAWRRVGFTDPDLPPSALPPDWPHAEARRLRDELLGRFLEPARAYVDSLP